MTEVLKQKQYHPLSVAEMALSLFAVNEGYLDDVELKRIVDFEHVLHGFLRDKYADFMRQVNENPVYTDEVQQQFAKILQEFKQTQVY